MISYIIEKYKGNLEDIIIVDEGNCSNVLKKELFDQAYVAKGVLKQNDIYFFVPALILGGKESIDNGDANVHQRILFELGK